MIVSELGKLESVELRSVWPNEASSFTPWLSEESNLALLGQALGIELALQSQEQNVGPFRADILCKDVSSATWVLIENQIERTDHTHLGQLLTYAAGLHAVTIVWIASRFTDEHRAALDWLNEVTEDSVSFFGLEVELWRIGSSAPAPKFNVVSKPNAFVRTVSASQNRNDDRAKQYSQYWQSFLDYCSSHSSLRSTRKPGTDYWFEFSLGKAGYSIRCTAGMRDCYIGVALIIYNDSEKIQFNQLKKAEAEISNALPGAKWNEKNGYKESALEYWDRKTDPNNPSQWESQHRSMLEKLLLFKKHAPLILGNTQ